MRDHDRLDAQRLHRAGRAARFSTASRRRFSTAICPGGRGAALGALELPDITLLLPTRRATRALQEAFLAASGGRAMLLPKIMPVSEGEEDLSLHRGPRRRRRARRGATLGHPARHERARAAPDADAASSCAGPRRCAARARGVRAPRASRRTGSSTPAQAATLAAELARSWTWSRPRTRASTGSPRWCPRHSPRTGSRRSTS